MVFSEVKSSFKTWKNFKYFKAHMVCHVCGDTGLNDMLMTCSRCKGSREHIYCMRICLDSPPEHWCCEEFEDNSGTDSHSPPSAEDLPKALPSNCTRRLQSDSARPSRLLNDQRANIMDRNKKFQTGKVKPLSPQEVSHHAKFEG